jgi:hypothetical protein
LSKTTEAVHHVLATASENEEEPSACELIEALIDEHGWPAVRDEMLSVLRSHERLKDWHAAAEVILRATLDGRELVADDVIAHVYYRLPEESSPESLDCHNLAWSIASRLKGVDYFSDYDPLGDEGVQRVLERLEGRERGTAPVKRRDANPGKRRERSRHTSWPLFLSICAMCSLILGLLVGGERYLFSGPVRPVVVTVVQLRQVLQGEGNPTYSYVVTFADGRQADHLTERRYGVGDEIEVMAAQGNITGRMLVSGPERLVRRADDGGPSH